MMGEMEHECWNIENFRDSWKLCKTMILRLKISTCLLDWADLSNYVKGGDGEAVHKIPEFLGKVGL